MVWREGTEWCGEKKVKKPVKNPPNSDGLTPKREHNHPPLKESPKLFTRKKGDAKWLRILAKTADAFL